MNYSAIRAIFCNSGQQSQAELRFYRGGLRPSEAPTVPTRRWSALLQPGQPAQVLLPACRSLPRTFTQLFTGILLDVCIGVDQQIGTGVACCALHRFHITAGDQQLIGGTGMPQTVKHNAGELRVLVLPLDELFADEDRLYRQNHWVSAGASRCCDSVPGQRLRPFPNALASVSVPLSARLS